MRPSAEIEEVVRDLWAAIGRGDRRWLAERFADDAQLVGTDPGDWYVGADVARHHVLEVIDATGGFGVESLELRAFEGADAGWFADRIVLRPDGGAIAARATGVVARDEAGTWNVVQLHLSVGTPDAEMPGFEDLSGSAGSERER